MKLDFRICMLALLGSSCAAPPAAAPRSAAPARAPSSPVARAALPPARSAPAVAPTNEPPEDDTRRQVRELRSARALFLTFIEKAGDRAEYADAVRRSRERIEDIERTIDFLEGRDP